MANLLKILRPPKRARNPLVATGEFPKQVVTNPADPLWREELECLERWFEATRREKPVDLEASAKKWTRFGKATLESCVVLSSQRSDDAR